MLYQPREEELVEYYWAYGSNLCIRDMKRRCPLAKPIRRQFARRGFLVFRGVADVMISDNPNDVVAGGLWKITPECEAALDIYEGVKHDFYEKMYLPVKIKGKKKTALFYKMKTERGIEPAYEGYFEVIARGYKDFGLDMEFLYRALEHSWSHRNKTPNLLRRWIARGKPSLARATRERPRRFNAKMKLTKGM